MGNPIGSASDATRILSDYAEQGRDINLDSDKYAHLNSGQKSLLKTALKDGKVEGAEKAALLKANLASEFVNVLSGNYGTDPLKRRVEKLAGNVSFGISRLWRSTEITKQRLADAMEMKKSAEELKIHTDIEAVVEKAGRGIAEDAFKTLADSKDSEKQLNALKALEKFGEPKEVIARLVPMLRDKTGKYNGDVLAEMSGVLSNALGASGSHADLPLFVEMFGHIKNSKFAANYAESLGKVLGRSHEVKYDISIEAAIFKLKSIVEETVDAESRFSALKSLAENGFNLKLKNGGQDTNVSEQLGKYTSQEKYGTKAQYALDQLAFKLGFFPYNPASKKQPESS